MSSTSKKCQVWTWRRSADINRVLTTADRRHASNSSSEVVVSTTDEFSISAYDLLLVGAPAMALASADGRDRSESARNSSVKFREPGTVAYGTGSVLSA